MTRLLCNALALAGLAIPITAQSNPFAPRLLRDIFDDRVADSAPADFVTAGPWTYFTADGANGRELYRSGGDARTTALYWDTRPGSIGGNPDIVGVVGAAVYVEIDNALFFTRGVPGDQRPILDSEFLLTVGGRALIARDTGGERILESHDPVTNAFESLYRTSGSFAVLTNAPGATRVGLLARESTTLRTIQTDGTAGGTVISTSIPSSLATAFPILAPGTVLPNGRFIYSALRVSAGSARWLLRSVDVATGSTADILDSASPNVSAQSAVLGARLVIATPGLAPDALIATDGTPSGTVRLSTPSGSLAPLTLLGRVGDTLIWAQENEILTLLAGENVLRSLGSTTAVPLADAATVAGRLYTAAADGGQSRLLAIDPAARTITQPFNGNATSPGVRGNRLVFAGQGPAADGLQPWILDPQTGSAEQLASIRPARTPSSFPSLFTKFGDQVVFATRRRSLQPGAEIWITQGVIGSTRSIGEIDGVVSSMVVVGGELWIFSNSTATTNVYVTDGTSLSLLANLSGVFGGSGSLIFGEPAVAFGDDSLLLSGATVSDRGIYRLHRDGTVQLLSGLGEPFGNFAVLGDLAVYAGRTQIYVSDGTPSGTRLLTTASSTIRDMAVFDDKVFVSTFLETYATNGSSVQTFGFGATGLAATADALFAVDTSGVSRLLRGASTATRISSVNPSQIIATLGQTLVFREGNTVKATEGVLGDLRTLINTEGIDPFFSPVVTSSDELLFGIFENTKRRIVATDGTVQGTRQFDGFVIRETLLAGGWIYASIQAPDVGLEPFVIEPGAVAERSGRGCSSSVREVALSANGSPRLSAGIDLIGRATGSTMSALLLGAPSRLPFDLPGSPCALAIDPVTLSGFDVPLNAAGEFRLPLLVPDTAAILGLRIQFQALFDAPGSSTLDVSNALLLQIGV